MDTLNKPTTSTVELNSIIAMQIYQGILASGNADLCFKHQSNSIWDNENIKIVDKEVDKVISEIKQLLSTDIIETSLKSQLTSDLLTTNTVYIDFKGSKTYTELKAEYTVIGII